MTTFKIYDEKTAPEGARPILETAKKTLGFVPNLFGTFAEAPAALEAYTTLGGIFDKTTFTPTERAVVKLAASADNACEYCVGAESAIAHTRGVDREVVAALRERRPIGDQKLEALRRFTIAVTSQRGWVSDDDVGNFLDAGYGREQVLEVIVGLALKTLSNYTNHIAQTPLDDAFKSLAWKKPELVPAA